MKASSKLETLDDMQFLTIAKRYTMTKDMNFEQHLQNLDYIKLRCDKLGYKFIRGCCGTNKLEKINELE